MSQSTELLYTSSHEWIRTEADGSCTIGITDHAQEALGELVYVELPDLGSSVTRGDACAVVESTKAASDVYSPLDGEVVAVNEALGDEPQAVNESPFDAGWLFRIKPSDESQKGDLLSADAYAGGLDE
ncbi:MAG: glycine cleavage system protein GcvH [Burkholderiaceae bacterium]